MPFRNPLLLCLLVAAPSSLMAQSGEDAYRQGWTERENSVEAKRFFREAADRFDAAWREGASQTVELSLMRAKAHRLAGDRGASLAAVVEGLRRHPDNTALLEWLDRLREETLGDSPPALHDAIRPPSAPWMIRRIPSWLWHTIFAIILIPTGWRLGWAILQRRRRSWIVAGALFLVVAATSFVREIMIHRFRETLPAVVVRTPTKLYSGNSYEYPVRRAETLPAGCEVMQLHQRGDGDTSWVQVRLNGGAVGWLPTSTLISCGE